MRKVKQESNLLFSCTLVSIFFSWTKFSMGGCKQTSNYHCDLHFNFLKYFLLQQIIRKLSDWWPNREWRCWETFTGLNTYCSRSMVVVVVTGPVATSIVHSSPMVYQCTHCHAVHWYQLCSCWHIAAEIDRCLGFPFLFSNEEITWRKTV